MEQQQKKHNPEPQDATSLKMNDQGAWEAFRAKWRAGKGDRLQAEALRFFDADDQIPLSKHFLLVGIVGFFLAFVIWANLATLDEVTRGDGKVIPSSEVQALQSLDSGIVEELLVKEGELVEVGQILVRLRDIEASSDLGANRARYYGLLASIARLQAHIDGKPALTFPEEIRKNAPKIILEEQNLFQSSRSKLQAQINVLKEQQKQRQQELRELTARMKDLSEIIALQTQETNMIAPLVEKGSASKLELMQLERTLQQSVNERNALKTSIPRTRSAIAEAEARITDIKQTAKAENQNELSVKTLELNQIKERLSGLEERKVRREIKSPVDGTVQELTANTIGGVVRAGEDVIKIVPKDDQLVIEALIKPSDRAFIYPGQKAIIKITAYDFSIYGGLDGELIDISADTIKDEQGQHFYRLRLRTFEKELRRKGEILPIIPGMVSSIDIITGKKTVMQYLLKPLIKTLDNAMKER